MALNWIIQGLIVVGTIAFNYFLAPKRQDPPKTKIDQLQIPNSEEGRSLPVIFGTVEMRDPTVVFYDNLDLIPIKSGGGKK